MKYKCADDIYRVLHERMQACPYWGGDDMASLWHSSDPLTQEAIGFLRLFNAALDDAPDGWIGVGRITYAESVLMDAQKGLN